LLYFLFFCFASDPFQEVEKGTTKYNELATKLELIPCEAKNALGADYSVTVDTTATEFKEMLKAEMKHIIRV
jgi:hypothetical protein